MKINNMVQELYLEKDICVRVKELVLIKREKAGKSLLLKQQQIKPCGYFIRHAAPIACNLFGKLLFCVYEQFWAIPVFC